MTQSQHRPTQQLFQQAKHLHQTYKVGSNQLENKLNYMKKIIDSHSSFLSCAGFCLSSKIKVGQGFKRAYKTLTVHEQVLYFWRNCQNIKLSKDKKPQNPQKTREIIKPGQKQMLDTTIYVKDKHEYKNWTVTRIQASLRTKKITFTDQSFIFDMKDYLIRNVKSKQKNCFALECTNSSNQFQTIKISNQGHTYSQTYQFIKKIHKESIRQTIQEQISPRSYKVQSSKVQALSSSPSPLMITKRQYPSNSSLYDKMMSLRLTSSKYQSTPIKTIQKQMLERQRIIRYKDLSFNQIYKEFIQRKVLDNVDALDGFQKQRQNQQYILYHHKKEPIVKKIYKWKADQVVLFDWLVDQLNNMNNFHKWRINMQKISCLKVFPTQRSKVLHQVFKHQDGKKYNYLFVRHHFDLPNINKNSKYKKDYLYLDKSVVTPIAKGYFGIPEPLAQISYIIWKFSQTNETVSLTIQAKCNHFGSKQNNLKMIQTYLGDFEKIKNSLNNNDSNDELPSEVHFNTILFENQYIEQINDFQEIDNNTQFFTISDMPQTTIIKQVSLKSVIRQNQMIKSQRKIVSFQQIPSSQNISNLLKFNHPIKPYKKEQPKLKQPKTGNHPQWESEWIINNKGQLINVNKEKIQAQNNVLKTVFKNMGRNFMSGKSMLSISLPVEVFGDDSNLSRLCNSYGFAPLFLEQAAKASDPVERFKKVISFGLSSMIQYLRMDKPFNPILGETYQSLIDGCLVYGQQISHHPPISAAFLKGRGYTLYGHLQAKVELSLNSASGINQGTINISFDSQNLQKQVVKYTAPAGQLSGVMFGDRKMLFIKKSYYIDQANRLFCEVSWGKSKGKSDYSNKFHDAVEGRIVKIKSSVNIKTVKTYKKDDVQQQIGLINGRWTGAVFYDQDLLFDTYKTYPYVVEQYQPLLESDVSKRKDLILRRTAVDLGEAQDAKQELQQIQRRDRKLRAEYTCNKH